MKLIIKILIFYIFISYTNGYSQVHIAEHMKLSIENEINNIIVKTDTSFFKDSKLVEKIFFYDKENVIRKVIILSKNQAIKKINIGPIFFSGNIKYELSLNYYKTGNIETFSYDINYASVTIEYFENGSIKKYYSSYDTYPSGYKVSFCENGQKELEQFYDSLSYTQQGYYCNGSLKFKGVVINHKNEEGSFLKGLPDGKWVFWHKNGKISKEIYFEKSKILKTVKYDEEGVLYFEKEEKEPVEVLFHEGYVLGELGEIYN